MASTSKKNESSVLFDQPGPKGLRTIRIANIIAAAVFAVVLVLILMRLAAPPDGENQLSWELWKPALEAEAWTDFYLPGLWMTIQASILAVIGAVAFGLVFGIGRLLPNPLLRGVSAVVVEFCRAVPVLLMMIFFWRGFAFLGIGNSSYWAVVLALVLYNGSVVAELVRSGVGNLPSGQREASLALGLTETQSLMQIEVPQAVFAMLPAAVTQLVVVLKDTALGSIIMYTDLLQESRRLGSMYFNILQTLVVAAVIYFVFCWLLSRLAEWLPEKMRQRTAAPTEAEAVARSRSWTPSNINQIAVAKEVDEKMFTAGAARASTMCTTAARTPRSANGVAPGTCRVTTRRIPKARSTRRPWSSPNWANCSRPSRGCQGIRFRNVRQIGQGGVTRICLVPVD